MAFLGVPSGTVLQLLRLAVVKLQAATLALLLEEKPAHHPLEPLDVALKHTGWMPPAYLYSLAESAKVGGKRIVNSDIN